MVSIVQKTSNSFRRFYEEISTHVASRLQDSRTRGISDAGVIIESVICNFSGHKNREMRRKLERGRFVHAQTFSFNGFETSIQFFDRERKKPTEWEVKTKADIALKAVSRDDSCTECRPYDVVGFDLGDRFILGAFSISSEGKKLAMKVRKKCYYETTTRRIQRHCEAKKGADIFEVERLLPGSRSSSTNNFGQFVNQWSIHEARLHNFYNEMNNDAIREKIKREQSRFWDCLFNDLLAMVDLTPNINLRQSPTGREVVFAIGMGKFKSVYGLPSLHSRCAEHLIRKARAMGIKVVGVDEWCTSQVCPCCLSKVKLVPDRHLRVMKCSSCKKYYHRDVMAAENHAIIAKYILEGREMPKCFDRNVAQETVPK